MMGQPPAARRFHVKSLNSDFQLLRSNAIQRKRFQEEKFRGNDLDYDDDDRVSLLRDEEEHLQQNRGSSPPQNRPQKPPVYVVRFESLNLELENLNGKVSRLEELYRDCSLMKKPDLFQDEDHEATRDKKMNQLSQEVLKHMSLFNQEIKNFKSQIVDRFYSNTTESSELESVITRNIVIALSNRLQDISERYRKSQNGYLKHLEGQKAKSDLYFEDFEEISMESELTNPNSFPMSSSHKISTQELLQLEENTKFVEEREREIQQIVHSISDLNSVFKDLAQMVSEQGTLVDRIDHNIENTQIKVEEGLKQLKKAETYQKKNRKMHCIVILAVILVILLFILMIKVS